MSDLFLKKYFVYLKNGAGFTLLMGNTDLQGLSRDFCDITSDQLVSLSSGSLGQEVEYLNLLQKDDCVFFIIPLNLEIFLKKTANDAQIKPEHLKKYCLELFSDSIHPGEIDGYQFDLLRRVKIEKGIDEHSFVIALKKEFLELLSVLANNIGAQQFWVLPEHTFLQILSSNPSSRLHGDALYAVILKNSVRFYIVHGDVPFPIELNLPNSEINSVFDDETSAVERLHAVLAPIILSHISIFESRYGELKTYTVHLLFLDYKGVQSSVVISQNDIVFSYELSQKLTAPEVRLLLERRLFSIAEGGNNLGDLVYGPIDAVTFQGLEESHVFGAGKRVQKAIYFSFAGLLTFLVICLYYTFLIAEDVKLALVEKESVVSEIQGIEARLVEREQFFSTIGKLDFYGGSFDKSLQIVETFLPRDIRVERVEAMGQDFRITPLAPSKETMAVFIEILRNQGSFETTVLNAEEVRVPSNSVVLPHGAPYKAVILVKFKEAIR